MGGSGPRSRRFSRALAVALAVAVAGAGLVGTFMAPPAAASSHQQLWWNEDGAGFRTFGANAAVNIYLGTATPGTCDGFYPYTDIYVVSESTLSDGQTLTDVSNPTGVPNTVMLASGGVFIEETIGFTVPSGHLGAGTYGVVYDECQNGAFNAGVDKLFYPAFEVAIDPANIPPIDPAIAALKGQAQAEADSWQFLVDAVETIELLIELKEYYECLSGGLAGCAISMLSDALQDYLKDAVMGALGLVDPKDAAKQAVLSTIKHYGGIAADPPDPDFSQPTTLTARSPITPDRDDPIGDAIVAVGNSQLDEAALAEALLHAIERYQGADAAGNGGWALAHAREIQALADDLGTQLADSDATLAGLDAALTADPRDHDAAAAAAETERARIAAGGFDADELSFLSNHGVGPVDRDALRDEIVDWSLAGFTVAGLQTRVDDLRAEITSLTGVLGGLETDMQDYIDWLEADPGTFDVVPTARAGGPYSATEGVAVSLDGSASTDDGPISAYAWDTDGDGAFDDASGATPSVTFPAAGTYAISLRVTDGNGNQGVDSAIVTVAEANGPPSFTSTSPAGPHVDLDAGASQLFEAAATDPDSDPVALRWLIDSVEATTGPQLTYSPTVADTGMHTVRVEASDGLPAGGTSAHEWSVSVLQPDADGDGWRANVDCDDTNPAIPGELEVVGNGADDDCDPATPDSGSAPVAGFTQAVAPGLVVTFTDTSTDANDDITGWSWDFGDGSAPSTDQNPTHTYASKGNYPVTLNATDATGLTGSTTKSVNVASPPAASFTYEPAGPVGGSEVTFTDTSIDPDGAVVGWSWSFGDGGTSTDQHPAHTFADPGTFTVTLTVTDDDGASATATEAIVVAPADPGTAPAADFAADVPPRDLAATANGGTVVDSSGQCCGSHEPYQMLDDNVGYPWATSSAAAGHYATIQIATGSARLIDAVQVQPRSDGWYEQRVRDFAIDISTTGFAAGDFTNVLNATAENSGTLQTFALPPGTVAKYVRYRPLNNRGGCCNISTSKFKVIASSSGARTVTFENLSVNAATYKWDFGDGGTSTAENPTHTYATTGVYTVTLTAKAADGRKNTVSHLYEARGPTADFSVLPATPAPGEPAVLTDASLLALSPAASFHWDFGDGTTSTTSSGTLHTFAAAGDYEVTYTVADKDGNSDAVTKTVTVAERDPAAPPNARFAPSSGGANVAASGGGASVHSFSGQYSASYPVATILDENSATSYWATPNGTTNGWVKIDLAGDLNLIDRVRIAGDASSQRVRDFTVSVSSTGTADADFTEVLTATNPNDDALHEYVLPGGAVTARYVRLNSVNNWGSACCVAVDRFDVLTGASVNAGRNLALAPTGAALHSYSSRYSTSYPAETLIDGDASNNYWATQNGTTNGWVKIDLAGDDPRMVDRIQIQPRYSNQRVKDFEIAVSWTGTDDEDFVTVVGSTLNDNENLTDVVLPYPMPAKYVLYRALTNRGSTCCVSTNQIRVHTGQESNTTTVSFRNLSSGATSYLWDFGDGSAPRTDATPTHTFPGPGSYTVTLTATNANGSSTFTLEQVVRAASFDHTPAAPEAQQQIDFSDTSPAELGLVSWSWDFGDGTGSAFANPVKTYASPGAYTVTLTGTDRDGNQRTAQRVVDVAPPSFRAIFHPQGTHNVASLENGAAVIDFSSQYDSGSWSAPKLLDYSFSTAWHSSNSPAQSSKWIKFSLAGGATYQIDRFLLLGRQDCCHDQHPRDFEIAVSTTGTADADFKTVLRATLPAGQTSPVTFMLPRPVQAKYVLYRALNSRGAAVVTTAALRAASGQAGGATVTFDDLTLGGVAPLSYEWDFGDGSAPSTDENPAHTFPGPGIYDVTLTVTDGTGATSSHTLTQRVLTPLAPTFTNSPLVPNEAQSTTFNDTTPAPASGPIVERKWTWDDGTAATTTTAASTTHTFADNGTYDVTLEIRDAWGQVGTVTQTVTVTNVAPTVEAGPSWRWREDRALLATPTTADIAGTRDPVTCTWSYGDGTPDGSGCTFNHTYADTGTYTATAVADDGDGGTATDSFTVEVIEQELPSGGGGGGSTGTGAGKESRSYVYTLDDDFELGTLMNVNHDAPGSDQLQLNKEAKPFPFVYVAASGRGTTLRVDVNTGAIVGEYRTAPENRSKNPSRTTVDKLGNVWVTNRDEAETRTIDGLNTQWGSATRIGLIVGGTRTNASGDPDPLGEYLEAPFEYNTCVDRDGDGLIRTSRGRGSILSWPNSSGVDHDGGVETATDECIQYYVRVRGTNTRTVAIDAQNDAWIGGANNWHEEVDGDTGQRVPGTAFSLGCGGYGGLIDGNGVLWSARYGSGLLRYDTVAKTGVCLGNSHGDYGLGVDPVAGNIWHTNLYGNRVVKLDPAATTAATIEIARYPHGNNEAQGVAVDSKGNVWVAHALFSATTIGRVRTDGLFLGTSYLGPNSSGPTGVSVDANGKVWAANYNTNNVSRIDPEIGQLIAGSVPSGWYDMSVDLGSGASPYNYSDMTGSVAVGAASPSGFWSIKQDAGADGTIWQDISWDGSTPGGTTITVEVRAADAQTDLTSTPFVTVSDGAPLSGIVGRFIEVHVTLQTTDPNATPILTDIRINANNPPVADDVAVTTETDTPVAVTLPASDPDGDSLTITHTDPSHGSFDGTDYTPDPGYSGPDSFTYTATDPYGDSDTGTVSVTVTPPVVENEPPIAEAGGPYEIEEDGTVALDGSGSTDPDGDPLDYEWDLDGDGEYDDAVGATASFSYDDGPAVRTVGLRVTDPDDAASTDTATVTVTNLAPTGTLGASSPIAEGSSAVVEWTAVTDPSAADTAAGFRYSFACDGNMADLASSYGTASAAASTSCAFDEDGSYTVAGRVFDDDGGYSTDTASVTVTNVAPTATLAAPASVAEGDSFTLEQTGPSDPSGADTTAGFEYAFDCGDGYGPFGPAASATCTNAADDGTLSVRASIRDDDGGTTENTASVTVTNLAPDVSAGNDGPAPWGEPVELTAAGSDPSAADEAALTYEWDIDGDGVYDTAPSGDPTHVTTYADPGAVTARVRACDDDGGCDEAETTVSVLTHDTQLAYDGDLSGVYSDPATLAATLTDTVTGLPVPGKAVGFTFEGGSPSGTTDLSGRATASVTVTGPAGSRPVTAVFVGDTHFEPSGDVETIVVARETATIAYSGDTLVTGTSARLAAVVDEDPDGSLGDITRAAVTFDVYVGSTACGSGTPTRYGPVPVSDTGVVGDGRGTAEVTMPTASEQTYCIVARLTAPTSATGGNDYYAATPAQVAVLTVVSTTGKFATGGGWIVDDDTGGHGNFGFTARFTRSGAPKGSAVYVWRTTYQGELVDMIIKSNAITGISFADLNGNGTFPWRATIEGKGTLRVNRASDGSEVLSEGNATFQLVAVDSGASSGRGRDSFALRVLDKHGTVVKEVGTWSGATWSSGILLSGGNEVVHLR